MNEQAVKQFLTSYGISVASLASKLGISKDILNNKLNPRYRNKLSEEEQTAIKAYFLALHKHTREFLAADLNELPASLREAE